VNKRLVQIKYEALLPLELSSLGRKEELLRLVRSEDRHGLVEMACGWIWHRRNRARWRRWK
jgi:hypothetical protein